jgi:HSP20 family protein
MTKTSLTRRPGSLFTSPLFSDPLVRRFFEDDVFSPRNFLARRNEALGENAWLPAVDVRETDNEFVFVAELPGLAKDDVSIEIEDKVLTISGERSFEGKEDNPNYHRIERSYGTFSRGFSLPQEVDQEKVTANFNNGLLTISIPKTEAVKPRKIEIK